MRQAAVRSPARVTLTSEVRRTRATVYRGPRDVRVEQVPDPAIKAPTDAVVRITHACICGSDLWPYRGIDAWKPGWRIGHEWMGVVEDVGAEVRTVKREDRVLAPFADGTLVGLPPWMADDDARLTALLPLTDVMATGHHAARSAGITPGTTAAIVGDGAVALCGVLAARRLGAARILVLGHHAGRLDLARRLGATDLASARGEAAVAEAVELTQGGAECVLECVGSEPAMRTAIQIARPGGAVGYVGVPHGAEAGLDLGRMFRHDIAIRGGVAPARAYIPELMADVLAGRLDPSPVFDLTVPLERVPDGYAAMDERRAIKVMVRVS